MFIKNHMIRNFIVHTYKSYAIPSMGIYKSASNVYYLVETYMPNEFPTHTPPTSVLVLHPLSLSILDVLKLLQVVVHQLVNSVLLDPCPSHMDLLPIRFCFNKIPPMQLLL